MTGDEQQKEAGEVGVGLADDMAEKAISVIDGFPGKRKQKAAIALIVSEKLSAYAERLGV